MGDPIEASANEGRCSLKGCGAKLSGDATAMRDDEDTCSEQAVSIVGALLRY